jgi:hypothetical protein
MTIEVPRIQKLIDEFLPIIRPMAVGRYAISIGGSHGKRVFDERSDVDFRLFCDEIAGGPRIWESDQWKILLDAVTRWRAAGIEVDYCWVRTVDEINKELDAWLDGDIHERPVVWTLWGYHMLTDINNQMIIEDPDNLIGAWQARLAHYPEKLKKALLQKHSESLRYWRFDYHYHNKVVRHDPVFLASMAAHLVHDMMQVLFALNEFYYVGDGNNLKFVARFAIKPVDMAARVEKILYPGTGADCFDQQYQLLCALIDDILQLADPVLEDLK